MGFTFINPRSPHLHPSAVDERWKIYPEITINVAMLQTVEASEGSDSVAVVDYPKIWSFTGEFLAPGDQVPSVVHHEQDILRHTHERCN